MIDIRDQMISSIALLDLVDLIEKWKEIWEPKCSDSMNSIIIPLKPFKSFDFDIVLRLFSGFIFIDALQLSDKVSKKLFWRHSFKKFVFLDINDPDYFDLKWIEECKNIMIKTILNYRNDDIVVIYR